jgi:hypothetical protein
VNRSNRLEQETTLALGSPLQPRSQFSLPLVVQITLGQTSLQNPHISCRQIETRDRTFTFCHENQGQMMDFVLICRLTLNLKSSRGQEIARSLVEKADILVEN